LSFVGGEGFLFEDFLSLFLIMAMKGEFMGWMMLTLRLDGLFHGGHVADYLGLGQEDYESVGRPKVDISQRLSLMHKSSGGLDSLIILACVRVAGDIRIQCATIRFLNSRSQSADGGFDNTGPPFFQGEKEDIFDFMHLLRIRRI